MKASAIYRKAAEYIDSRDDRAGLTGFYGLALDAAGQPEPGGDTSPLQNEFEDLFDGVYGYWWNSRSEDSRDVQVLALLFMSAIAKDAK